MMLQRVESEGPTPCDVLFVGEYPGIEELRLGRPFVGKTGRELTRYMNGYTLPDRDRLHLTNLKFAPPPDPKKYAVLPEEQDVLAHTIATVNPKTVVALGAHVVRYLCGEDATLEAYHGILHPCTTGVTTAIVFPTYNPAAALHAPGLQAWFAYDMRRLGLHLRGKLPPAARDEHPGHYCESNHHAQLGPRLGLDTEGWIWNAWGLSYSREPYEGIVVQRDHCGLFCAALETQQPAVTLHNALHDRGVLRSLGIDLDALGLRVDDTMLMAYLLGLEPQGLKPLAYRHAGMLQDDYQDIVRVPQAMITEQWLDALTHRLPYKPLKPVKVSKRAARAGTTSVPLPLPHGRPATPDETDLAHARGLVEKMIAKNDPLTLTTRWANCRAREILVDEIMELGEDEADPPDATLDNVDPDVAVRYAGRDADATTRIFPTLDANIDAMKLRNAYEVDMQILPMVDRMQVVGLGCDVEWYRGLSEMFGVEWVNNQDDIARLCGRRINPNSGDQVAEYLFDELRVQDSPSAQYLRLKQTKGGRISTNDKTLEALWKVHPSIRLFQEGREIKKMDSTYAKAIARLVSRTDFRLHPNYRLTATDTGRLAAGRPNVLALPKHSKRGKLIRHGLMAGEGRVLSEWDLDQIEMRVFAHDSGDERMLDAFLSGKDLHADTAAMLHGLKYEELYAAYKKFKAGDESFEWADEKRFSAKAVNFGILMGITEFGLLDQFHKNGQLHWTLDMCSDLLRQWHKTYVQGSQYIDLKHAEARRYGFVRDMFDRVRYLEGVHSVDKFIEAEALRMAQATPTQSGAQGIIKRAMAMLWPILCDFRRQGMWVECLLQVHDALVLEHDVADTAIIDEAVLACLMYAVELKVPVTAKGKLNVHRLSEL